MSDGDDNEPSNWLSRQFEPTEQVPTARPAVSKPEPNADGGFNWGLKPGGSVAEPPAPARPEAPAESNVAPPLEPYAGPPTEPYAGPPTEPYVPEPTRPLSWDEFASTQQQNETPPPAQPVSPFGEPTQAYTPPPWQPAVPPPDQDPLSMGSDEPTSAIDSLFGDHKFEEYQEVGVLTTLQVPPAASVGEPTPVPPREPLSRTQKILMGVAGGLIGALILVGLFFLGEHLGAAAAAAPSPAKTSGSSPTPTPAGTGGPAAPGARSWTALQGGECIQPFSSAWAQTFTVVACTADHDAQMVFKGTLPDSSSTPYPSATAFQQEVTPLCRASTSINYAAAASVTDLRVSFSYPPNSKSWNGGDRTYYCFVDRVSGGNLPGDLSVPKSK